MSWRGDFGRSFPSPSTSEDRKVISHQVFCPFIGAFDLTLLWCSSVISSPFAVKMLIERRRNHCLKKASSGSLLFILWTGLSCALSEPQGRVKITGCPYFTSRRSPISTQTDTFLPLKRGSEGI